MAEPELKILLVDDEAAVLDLLSETLRSQGVQVCPVRNSRQASTLINQEKFDGIFLDLSLPEVDGFELTRRIRQSSSNSGTPVVIITAVQSKDTMSNAFAAGANFFLTKPVKRPMLIRLLNSTRGVMLMERRRYQRSLFRTEVTCQGAGRTVRGTSASLSGDGILFQGDGSFGLRSRVQLSFRVRENDPEVRVEGVVVRQQHDQKMGVRFIQLSDSDRKRIEEATASGAGSAGAGD